MRDDEDTVLEDDPKVGYGRRYAVVFYNDDYTTKWFVVEVLERFFRMDETAATALMMAVHEHGKGVAGVYTPQDHDLTHVVADVAGLIG